MTLKKLLNQFEPLNLQQLVRNVSILVVYWVHKMDLIHNQYMLDVDVEKVILYLDL
jgi:hypothetical protein